MVRRVRADEVIDSHAIAHFRQRFKGPVILPGDLQYEQARSVWNSMIQRRPALIVKCADESDVISCVELTRELELPLSVKAGGHNIAGLGVCDDGLTIDLSLMRGVAVDPSHRRAVVQGGCLLRDVDCATQQYGLATVLGFVSTTGAAGLTLGGGFGYLTRRFGWSSDQVRAIQVVVADGRSLRATESEHPDLFWGMRGGGANFGVATSIEYELREIGPEVLGGLIVWPLEDAPAVLELYRALAELAPFELACGAALRLAPVAPWLPAHIHGKPIVALFICWTGALDRGEKILRLLSAFPKPVANTVERRTYLSQQSLLDATQPWGRRYYWKSEYLSSVTNELAARLVHHADTIVSPHSALLLFPLGGALRAFPDNHSAAAHRDADFVVNIAAAWESPADDMANLRWARMAWHDVRRFSTGGTYVNFLTEEEGDDRIRAAYGSNYERLVEIKSRWDPNNVFRVNKNIRPSLSAR